jgi:hypothetical protein
MCLSIGSLILQTNYNHISLVAAELVVEFIDGRSCGSARSAPVGKEIEHHILAGGGVFVEGMSVSVKVSTVKSGTTSPALKLLSCAFIDTDDRNITSIK